VLVCHGALDPHVPTAQVTGFIEEMNEAGADFQLIVYGGAMHGFTHDVGCRGRASRITPSPISARSWPSGHSSVKSWARMVRVKTTQPRTT
jgi:dienelactone hydrolase